MEELTREMNRLTSDFRAVTTQRAGEINQNVREAARQL